jgi:pimeloyl-ACP methyl ester carboxylesterase
MQAVLANFDAVESADLPVAVLGALRMPVLLLTGSDSPAPVREVAQRLARRLPAAERWDLPGMGHMAPVTHPQLVDPLIRHFIACGGSLSAAA